MATIKLQPLFKHQAGLTGVFEAPGEPDNLYILEQKGRMLQYNKNEQTFSLFLDLSPEIDEVYKQKPMPGPFPDERGLLTIAFHPEYNTIGSLFRKVFVVLYSVLADSSKYSEIDAEHTPNPDHMTCLSQFRTADNPEKTKASKMVMLCIPEPQANHNGGGLLFGPDGYLWVGLGDGGGANDEHGPLLDPDFPDSFVGNAQNLLSLHGKLLRIEVVQPMPQNIPYAIPQDNPFVGREQEGRPEIAHWGFRNPWRMSFNKSGQLLVGDVGQNRFESVDLVQGLGNNYGWRAYEGHELFNARVAEFIRESGQSITPPLLDYPREMGTAIVGVIEYRGQQHPQLQGQLIIADFSGHLMVAKSTANGYELSTLFKLDNMQFRSMEENKEGEIYLTAFNPFQKEATLYNMVPKSEEKTIKENIIVKEKIFPSAKKVHSTSDVNTSDVKNTTVPNPHTVSTMDQKQIFLTKNDVHCIVEQAVSAAKKVKSALRIDCEGNPAHTRMHISLHLKGERTARLFRSMPDAWPGSIDISQRKAHTAYAFSSNENALTTSSIRALSQPKNVSGTISGNKVDLTVGNIPLWHIGNSNPEGGIIEFPGGVPLYKKDCCGRPVKVGAIGVSGDAVDRDETVARMGAKGYEAPEEIRSDTVANVVYYGPLAPMLETDCDGGHVHHMKTVSIAGREEWEAFKKKHPQGTHHWLMLFISGDRMINDLKEFMPYADRFISMNFFHSTLRDLCGLEKFVNLTSLNVSRTEIDNSQLRHIAPLTKLGRLELNGNDLSNLSPISGLNPYHLGLACLQISTLQPLTNMTNMRILDLYANPKLVDIYALTKMPLLEDIDIRQTAIDAGDLRRQLPGIKKIVA